MLIQLKRRPFGNCLYFSICCLSCLHIGIQNLFGRRASIQIPDSKVNYISLNLNEHGININGKLYLKLGASDSCPHTTPWAEDPPRVSSYSFVILRLTTWVSCHAPVSEVCSSCFYRLGYWQHQAQRCTELSLFWAHVPVQQALVKKLVPFSPNLVLHSWLWVNIGSSLQLQLQGLWGTRYEPVRWERSFVIGWKTGQIDSVSRENQNI